MSIIYGIKDINTNLFLTKDSNFSKLTTTTRTFQRAKKARQVIQNDYTLFWVAINELYKIKKERISINSKEFNDFLKQKEKETNLEVCKITIKEKNQLQLK